MDSRPTTWSGTVSYGQRGMHQNGRTRALFGNSSPHLSSGWPLSRQQGTELIDKDQARLRENMKALRGSPEEKALLQRYTRELDAQEDRLAGLRREISDLKAKRAQMQAELDTMVKQIGIDETL